MSAFNLPRAYAGVTFMTTCITMNYLVCHEMDKKQRQETFDESATHKMQFADQHMREVGDELPDQGLPDDGNGRHSIGMGYGAWYE